MSRIFKGKLGLLIRLVLSVGLIGGLVYHIGSADIMAQLSRVRWPVVAFVILVLASSVLVVTPRWTVILTALGYRLRWSKLVGSVFLGILFNQLLPTIVGGDVLRALRVRSLGVPLDVSIHSVLLDRATGVLVSLVGAAALLPFAHPHTGQTTLRWIIGVAAVIGISGCVVLWGLGHVRILKIPFVGRMQRELISLGRSASALAGNPSAAAAVFLLACANQSLPIVAIWLLAGDLLVSLPLVDIAFITFVASLAATLPISVAGWGIREGALVFLFGLYGVQPQTAFTISVLYGASLAISAAPGALVLLRRQTLSGNQSNPDRPGGI